MGIVNVPAHLRSMPVLDQPARVSVIQFAPPTTSQIQIAPQIFVPDGSAGRSNMLTEDEMCMQAMDEFENKG